MPHVLLVEDEPTITDTLVYALQTECFTVTHALTGAGALAAASSGNHDFAILDIGLPDMTGLDVCRRLRPIHFTNLQFRISNILSLPQPPPPRQGRKPPKARHFDFAAA